MVSTDRRGVDFAGAAENQRGLRAGDRRLLAAALFLAILFIAYAMRGAWETAPVYPDASRHAMNGALLLDMIRETGWMHPVQFASRYYAHLPAITIPYHPPLFPLFEAAVFSVFGVNTPSARFAVAICAGASFFLVFAWARASKLRAPAALAAAAVFVLAPVSSSVSTDVLLEFPSLVFAVASVWLVDCAISRGTPYRGLFAAGLLAAAAIWTKQNTVFLVAIPGSVALLRQEWKLLRSWRFWGFLAVSLTGFGVLMLLARVAGAAGNTGWRSMPFWERVPHHAGIYVQAFTAMFGWPATSLVVAVAGYAAIFRMRSGRFRNLDVHFAWIGASLGLLLVMPPWDGRYLFYTIPPLAVVLFAVLDETARAFRFPAALRTAGFAAAGAGALVAWHKPAQQVDGFDDAARFAASRSPQRLLVLSNSHNGAFVFEFRAQQSARKAYLLRGHGMAAGQYQAPEFLRTLHELGVDYVVLHDSSKSEPWEAVQSIRDERLRQEAAFEARITSQAPGVLRVYRFTNPSQNPSPVFATPSSIGADRRTSVLK